MPDKDYKTSYSAVFFCPTTYYLTNVQDPQLLSPQQVCDLYRRRWRVEEAFLLTKRLLGLAYLWVGGSNGVQILSFCHLDILCRS
jgi:hypothetical protein